MSKKAQVEEITLTFDLHELPTAQHRAGLAGLLFQIEAMGRKGYQRPEKLIPVLKEVTATSATIAFTPDSMRGVFDELYAAERLDQKFPIPKKKKDKDSPGGSKDVPWDDVEVSIVNGKEKRLFVYRGGKVRPLAPCLNRHIKQEAASWLELWRRMVWEILRNEQARAPFKQVASTGSCATGANIWRSLSNAQRQGSSSRIKSEEITGALMLGAQAVNAEGVSFSGRVDHNLLLHFWQLVVLTFVPQAVARKDAKVERVGYVLAIPDIADLIEFREQFPEILQNLDEGNPTQTPRKARLDLPAQAGLEILRRLRDQAQKSAAAAEDAADASERPRKRLASRGRALQVGRREAHRALAAGKAARICTESVRALEIYHMSKLGNNVKLLSFSRVIDRPGLVEDYEILAEAHRNPLFRAGLMRALLLDRPRHWGMIDLFAEYPHHFFLEIEGETPQYLPRFGRDARAFFARHEQEIRGMTPDEMNEDESVKRLGTIVHNLMKNYVNRRAAKKLGLNWDDFRTRDGGKFKGPPEERSRDFGEQQRQVCNDAFLQIRSNHDEDFVRYFTETILSVPQHFSAKTDDLIFVARILMTPPPRDPVALPVRNRDDIRTFAMLALSAISFNVRKRDPQKEGSPS